jgi:hypothetical protein
MTSDPELFDCYQAVGATAPGYGYRNNGLGMAWQLLHDIVVASWYRNSIELLRQHPSECIRRFTKRIGSRPQESVATASIALGSLLYRIRMQCIIVQ